MSLACYSCPPERGEPAVADGLCVKCGARLAVATIWVKHPEVARALVEIARDLRRQADERFAERTEAFRIISTPSAARTELERLAKRREERADELARRARLEAET